MNLYLQVFTESAWAASIVPMASDATLSAMRAFGGFNMPQAVLIAIAGATAGQMFNWLVGRLLIRLQQKNRLSLSEARYAKACVFFKQYLLFTLLLCALPVIGKFFALAAGFFGARARAVLPLVLAGNIGFYLYMFG